MADENPTYRVEPFGDTEKYTCLVSDAGHEDGICGHWSTDKELFELHMLQRHAGVMHEASAPQPAQSAARQGRPAVAEQRAPAAKE